MRLRLRSTTSRMDAAAIVTATTVAGLGAAGVKFEHLPVERIGEIADLTAGAFFAKHKITHWLKGRKHSTTTDKPAVVSICRDGRGRVTWKR